MKGLKAFQYGFECGKKSSTLKNYCYTVLKAYSKNFRVFEITYMICIYWTRILYSKLAKSNLLLQVNPFWIWAVDYKYVTLFGIMCRKCDSSRGQNAATKTRRWRSQRSCCYIETLYAGWNRVERTFFSFALRSLCSCNLSRMPMKS